MIFSNPFLVVLVGVRLVGLPSVLHKGGIVCKPTSLFLLRKQSLAVRKKLKYSVLRTVLHAMALVASQGQILKLALSVVGQDR